ncbi:MAG TPA: type II toxin-antitoxin system HigB family toxin [Bryobacteraceae bacterium]|nr:type II toxin-antitoxin system HigB family toxin [Bryobacteraceae bacterium]
MGEAKMARFSQKHAASRKPLGRFLKLARQSEWRHFPDIKKVFPATDYAASTGTLIFDLGGNKYRLIARVDFEEQLLIIDKIMTREEYERENL